MNPSIAIGQVAASLFVLFQATYATASIMNRVTEDKSLFFTNRTACEQTLQQAEANLNSAGFTAAGFQLVTAHCVSDAAFGFNLRLIYQAPYAENLKLWSLALASPEHCETEIDSLVDQAREAGLLVSAAICQENTALLQHADLVKQQILSVSAWDSSATRSECSNQANRLAKQLAEQGAKPFWIECALSNGFQARAHALATPALNLKTLRGQRFATLSGCKGNWAQMASQLQSAGLTVVNSRCYATPDGLFEESHLLLSQYIGLFDLMQADGFDSFAQCDAALQKIVAGFPALKRLPFYSYCDRRGTWTASIHWIRAPLIRRR